MKIKSLMLITIRKRLFVTVPQRKPLLSKKTMASQRRFAELYLNKPQDLWNNVLWTDKTKGESGVFFCEVWQLKLGPQQIFSKMGGKEKNQDACKGNLIEILYQDLQESCD